MNYDLTLSQIKNCQISKIISHYIPLKIKGKSYMGLCPFHNDTEASLVVYDNKGIFKCFACNSGGDAISFVQNFKKLSFIETLREISNLLELDAHEEQSPYKKILELANRLYQSDSARNQKNFQVFLKERNLYKESVDKFGIGYAVGNPIMDFINKLGPKDKKEAISLSLDLGLIKEASEGQFYDFFRDQVMFAIHDKNGEIRGFNSRSISTNQKPKYLNSRESKIFHKNQILYGLFQARKKIMELDYVILVEGNMDVISLHQYQYSNSIGIMGISLSQYSRDLIIGLTENIYLCLDTDSAGRKAMEKINNQFLEIGVLTKFLDLSPCKDPDEFINKKGEGELKNKIENAKYFIDHQIDLLIDKNPETLQERIFSLHSLFGILAPLGDSLTATERLIDASIRLKIQSDIRSILREYRNWLKKMTYHE